MASGLTVQALMASEPAKLWEPEKAAAILEALGSVLVGLPGADLERLQAAKR
jgi:hypothetical protein